MFRFVTVGLLLTTAFASGQEAEEVPTPAPTTVVLPSDAPALAFAEAAAFYYQGDFKAASRNIRRSSLTSPTRQKHTLA
jgi:hypothetical protein